MTPARDAGRDAARSPSALRFLLALSTPRLLAVVGLAALMAALGLLSLYSRLAIFSDGAVRPSAGDAIVWLFMGNPLGLAPEWGALWCLVLAISVDDVRGLVDGVGVRHVVACGKRGSFWRDLCLAVAIRAAFACALLAAFGAALAIALGGPAGLSPVCISTASLGAVSPAVAAENVAALLALVLLGAVCLSLLELSLSLFLGRPLALVACVALVLGSAFLPLLPLPGSWLMASRLEAFASSTTVTAAWPVAPGVCELVGIGALGIVLGGGAFGGLELGVRRSGKGERPALPRGRMAARCRLPLRYCVAVGARPLVPALVLAAGVTGMQCVALLTRTSLYAPSGAQPGLGDFLAFAFLGSSQPDPLSATVSAARSVSIQFGWLALVLLLPAWTHLFCRAMHRREVPTVLSGGRLGVWAARCVTATAAGTLVFLAKLLTCLVATVATGGPLSVECSLWFADVAGLARETLPETCAGLPAFLAGFACMSLVLMLVQLAVAEVADDVASLVAVVALLAGSAFLMSPVLLGNFLMCARSTVFVVPWQVEVQGGLLQAGLSPLAGIAVALLLGLAACLVGGASARSRELFGGADR